MNKLKQNKILLIPLILGLCVICMVCAYLAVITVIAFNNVAASHPGWIGYSIDGMSFKYPQEFELEGDNLSTVTNGEELEWEKVSLSLVALENSDEYQSAAEMCTVLKLNLDENLTEADRAVINGRESCRFVHRYADDVGETTNEVFVFFVDKGNETVLVMASLIYGANADSGDIEAMHDVLGTLEISPDVQTTDWDF